MPDSAPEPPSFSSHAAPLVIPVTPAAAPAPVPLSMRPVETVVDRVPSTIQFPIDGTLERGGGLPPPLLAFLALIAGFLATNIVGAVGGILLMLPRLLEGGAEGLDFNGVMAELVEQAGPFLALNAVGQLVGFALLAWAFARLSSSQPGRLLRWRAPEWGGLVLAVLGLFAITPVVQWLGVLNNGIPIPDVLRELEESSSAILEQALVGSGLSPLYLLLVMAVTPALCEELLFRGYMHRQVERRWGSVAAILVVGVVFGAFHLSATKLLPLSLLGVWMGYLVWATGSLWPSIVVHFLNNALAVAMAVYVQRPPEAGGTVAPEAALETLESATIPLWAVILGAVGTLGVAWALRVRRDRLARGGPARPDPVPSSLSIP